ncbi:MAG: type II toxin-antitoxin system HipA family toxin [Deltaproteobacteria bacterium]|nr:type II toxin-antitoxin system HipA family toxin [Deltaproteobacteria bacterium]
MIKLDIWVTFPDGSETPAGEMVCGDPDSQGRIPGAFRYTDEYLKHPQAFPFDPVALHLANDEFIADRPSGVFAVFEDSLPDDWGRRLLVRKAKLERGRQTIPNLLLALGGHGLGALSYFQKGTAKIKYNYVSEIDLEMLLTAAEKYEKGTVRDNSELRLLFQAGSSPGGARPKVIIEAEGALWLAKFPSVKDDLAVVKIEAATLSLAKKAGLNIPEFKLINCAGRDVLMVRRFDIADRGGRRHMISMSTLLKVEGWYNLSYKDIFEVLRVHSSQPEVDLPAMYRQMVFNALIGNTDDHLKNFMMLHDDSGYYLSPAYDLLPDTAERREHVLYFENDHYFPGVSGLESIGKRFGIRTPRKVAEAVADVVLGWKAEYKAFGVSKADIKRLEWGIDRRLKTF